MRPVAPSPRVRAAIVIPVFNDWDSLVLLLRDIDAALGAKQLTGSVTVIDDGSTTSPPPELFQQGYASLLRVEIIRLRHNLGHQRAIAVGLAHLANTSVDADAVVVMDGDGEDRPEDIVPLLTDLSGSRDRYHVVFAARTKRLEGVVFRLLYQLYRAVHRVLTGTSVRVGNFSALSPDTPGRLSLDSDMWNHYAAAVFRSRIPFSTVPLARGRRYRGASQMRFSSLVAHGLSAVAVFGEIVGARLIVVFASLVVLSGALVLAVIGIRLFTGLGIPGWATNAAGLLILFAMQSVLSLLVLVLILLGDRSQAKVIPARDAYLFIESVETLGEPQ